MTPSPPATPSDRRTVAAPAASVPLRGTTHPEIDELRGGDARHLTDHLTAFASGQVPGGPRA